MGGALPEPLTSSPFLSTCQLGFSLTRVRSGSGSVRSYSVSGGGRSGGSTEGLGWCGRGVLSVCICSPKTPVLSWGRSRKRPSFAGWTRRRQGWAGPVGGGNLRLPLAHSPDTGPPRVSSPEKQYQLPGSLPHQHQGSEVSWGPGAPLKIHPLSFPRCHTHRS